MISEVVKVCCYRVDRMGGVMKERKKVSRQWMDGIEQNGFSTLLRQLASKRLLSLQQLAKIALGQKISNYKNGNEFLPPWFFLRFLQLHLNFSICRKISEMNERYKELSIQIQRARDLLACIVKEVEKFSFLSLDVPATAVSPSTSAIVSNT